jgi:hypothetical protein
MRIAVLGSAPSSLLKAPFGDPSWEIWACSPGAYPHCPRVTEFWEVHRWEPGVIGKAGTQKPWFTPEYVAWLKMQPVVWVADPAAAQEIPGARMLPWQTLVQKYGHYVWTSSVAYMLAMAIDKITAARAARTQPEDDVIGLWGIDMAANEELYSGQRAACQFFLQVIAGLKIGLYVPPESDLAVPPPMYGVSELDHRAIKFMERRRELDGRLGNAQAQLEQCKNLVHFLQGAVDDLDYMQKMWLHEGDSVGFEVEKIFPALAAPQAEAPKVACLGEMTVIPPKPAPASTASSTYAPPPDNVIPVRNRKRRRSG